MHAVPVAMSLVASFMSAITVLGTPAEIYIYGTMFCYFGLTYSIVMWFSAEFYMPIFYRLLITSAYEYLEIRFKSKVVRILGCITFIAQTTLYMGIAIYAPSLALNAVTGFTLWGSVLTCGLVCTFYTTIGGMKAVLWTDVFQLSIMVAGFLAVIIQGSINVGGWGRVMEICIEGERIEFDNFSFDPTIRHTFWTICVGGLFTWLAIYGINQSQVQRYLTCRTERDARIAIYLNIPGLLLILALAACSGLVMYATYYDCDPYDAGYVDATDQLMPYFVMDILSFLPGLPGLFVSCMFSGALSTVSSGLNSLAAVTGEDIIRQYWKNIPEARYTLITKCLALCYGLFCVFMAWISSMMGDVLQAALSIFGMVGGPLLGLFSLAMFFPWANAKGAIVGLLTGLAMSFWVGIGGFLYPPYVDKPPRVTTNCTIPSNSSTTVAYSIGTTTEAPLPQDSYPPIAEFYSISYLYYGAVAWLTVIFIGLIVSFITGPTKPEELDPRTICPVVNKCCCFLPSGLRKKGYCGVQYIEREEDEDEKKSPEKQYPDDVDMVTVEVQADMDKVDGIKNDLEMNGKANSVAVQHESGL
ncbi:sodium-coupled monocarboxylate transporter 2-like isoform X2 [Ptychodera flava]|uniref:sodium-coupled monocarboxylate transporter 2-like isoform X2 n=1 Tax=Ptychodera flava TaxID=63121 RepID=UPI003969C651